MISDAPSKDIARDITVAWINALGKLVEGPNSDKITKETLLSPKEIADFYKTVLETVKS